MLKNFVVFFNKKYSKIFLDKSFKTCNEDPTFIPNPTKDLEYKTSCSIYKLGFKSVNNDGKKSWAKNDQTRVSM